ncbi:MAG TPA: MerR family transcriptional regulator [Candidatus Sumerlaeota bacterium]|nr:MerR family transcriptional regulator [Candidatus Sumerlaeota bacterium]HOR29518.1 MerR family transcriptional regulator [Candidatus Sumerlaeota bacterium]
MKTLTPPRATVRPTRAPAAPRRKLFYRINEVSRITGIKPYVLRYWETEFRELAPAKDSSDQRRYRQADIEVIQTIRRLLYEERYTIEGARKRLRVELRRQREDAQTAPAAASRPAQPAEPSHRDPRLTTALRNLRSEVNELLAILN